LFSTASADGTAIATSQIVNNDQADAAQSNHPAAKAMMAIEQPSDWVSVLSAKRGLNPLSIAPNFEDYFYEMMTAADYGDYWKVPDRNWSRVRLGDPGARCGNR
jgi:hypothetical protein